MDAGIVVIALGLTAAVLLDWRFRRIPNWLTLSLAVSGVSLHGLGTSGEGVMFSLLGMVVGLGIFFVPFMLGGMGAGDVKLMAALGAHLGALGIVYTGLLSGLAGGLVALIVLSRSGHLGSALHRLFTFVWNRMVLRVAPPPSGNTAPAVPGAAGETFPYAVCIAAGAVLTLWGSATGWLLV